MGKNAKLHVQFSKKFWLELNTNNNERRGETKHIICSLTFSNRGLNSKAYTVRRDLMAILDGLKPIEITHKCGQKFNSRIAVHDHMSDGTCPESFRNCPFCNKMFKLNPDWVLHVEQVHKPPMGL
jgi:uncharacterized C2H2 Zn-finger protein